MCRGHPLIRFIANWCTSSQENPARANGHIFNVGNPNNEVTVRQLAEMMTQVCLVIVRPSVSNFLCFVLSPHCLTYSFILLSLLFSGLLKG